MNELIYKQDAIDLVKEVCDAIMSGCDSHYDPETEDEVYNDLLEVDAILKCNKEIRIALANLSSAEPRKKGKWIYGEKSGQDGWYCSECGGFIPWYYDFYGLDNIDFIEEFKTCPFCDSKMVSYTGADMREGEEG